MAFSWEEYLVLAKAINRSRASFNSEEAACRSATSRAYYAAFCEARNFARDHHNYIPSYNKNDHYEVPSHFRNRGNNNIAYKLKDLRYWRNLCDYQDVVYNANHLAAGAIKRASQIFSHLAGMQPQPPSP